MWVSSLLSHSKQASVPACLFLRSSSRLPSFIPFTHKPTVIPHTRLGRTLTSAHIIHSLLMARLTIPDYDQPPETDDLASPFQLSPLSSESPLTRVSPTPLCGNSSNQGTNEWHGGGGGSNNDLPTQVC